MKNLSFTSAMLCVAALSASCCGQTEIETTTVGLSEEIALTEGRDNRLSVEISAEYPVFKTENEAGKTISSEITEALFGEEYMSMDPEAAVLAYKDALAQEYREENLPMLEEEGLENSASLNWSDLVSGSIEGQKDNILSYVVVHHAFRGGAHGMTAVTAYNFDTKSGKEIQETDFFKNGYEEKLTKLLTARLPEAVGGPENMEMLFIQEVEPNDNFYITEDGVTFIYNHYEIAPYAMGIIKITIPWNELEGLY